MRARSVIDGVNLGLTELPKGSFVGTILLGTISGSFWILSKLLGFGGVLIGNVVTRVLGKEDWSEISRPTWASKSSFYTRFIFSILFLTESIAYYVLIDPHHVFTDSPVLPEIAARFAVTAYLALNAFTVSVVGQFTPFPGSGLYLRR